MESTSRSLNRHFGRDRICGFHKQHPTDIATAINNSNESIHASLTNDAWRTPGHWHVTADGVAGKPGIRHEWKAEPESGQYNLNGRMDESTHTRFLSANQKLRDFLRRAKVWQPRVVGDRKDLKQFSMRLMTLAPEIGDASRSEQRSTPACSTKLRST